MIRRTAVSLGLIWSSLFAQGVIKTREKINRLEMLHVCPPESLSSRFLLVPGQLLLAQSALVIWASGHKYTIRISVSHITDLEKYSKTLLYEAICYRLFSIFNKIYFCLSNFNFHHQP